jgi:hypothetical protein
VPNTLRIKRRLAGGAAGAPSSLANAELAFNEQDSTLYYGVGTGGAGGTASSILSIAGPGAFATLGTTQTITGDKTFSGVITLSGTGTSSAVGVTQSTGDNSTRLATTAFVKSLGYGTGTVTSVGLSLPSFITVTNSPVTGSGTLTGTLASQTANTVFIAPDGTAGAPTFRALAAADIPTLTAAKISDFDTQVRTSRLDQMAAPTASVSLNSQKITNLADPTQATDAASKQYVDAARSGLDVKQSVRAASTATVTVTYSATGGTSTRGQITAAPNTLDGVTLAANDRILLKDQSTGAQNGIWVVSTLGTGANGVWDRATDFDSDAEVTAGAFTFVTEGTVNGDSGWVLSANDPIVIGGASGTAITFVQFSGAGQITAGAGLTKNGNVLDVASTGGGSLTINADSINLTSGIIGTPGTYRSVTVDTYGRVTAGSSPTTFSGYGISDTSANLAAAITDETGSGALVFGTGPSLTTPALSGETFSTTNNVTAGTNAQGQGALTSDYNVITTAAANPSGVTLPTATTGRRILVVNKGANPVNVYPATGAAIDALAANASIQLPAGQVMMFNASSTTQWYSSYNLNTVAGSSGVTSFSAGTTGLTPSTGTTGSITLAGTLAAANGGTGVNNGSNTITIGGNVSTAGALTFSGAFGTTFTVTATTALTLPTSGTVLSDGSTVDGGVF